MSDNRSLCVVFDLDDTLYYERDYQLSGFHAVAEHCKVIYGVDLLSSLLQWSAEGERDIFGRLCVVLDIPGSCKESLIWLYRNHFPQICLSEGAKQALSQVQSLTTNIAILTDGRSVTQRLKLRALGLSDLPVYISEEWGGPKPDKVRFEAIQKRFEADNCWYIGDNPRKDFLAPNQLCWGSIGLRGSGANVHSQDLSDLSPEYLPKHWVDSLNGVTELLRPHYSF